MGCSSNKNLTFENICNTAEFLNLQKVFDTLEIQFEDTRKLFDAFYSITSGLHSVPLSDILESLGLTPTSFAHKMFSIFNKGTSSEIDFRAFVLSCWNFCTLTRFNLDLFLYDMYYTSGNRPLSPLDVLNILEDIHGKAALKANIHLRSAVSELLDLAERGKSLNTERCHSFLLKHKAVLFPAFQVQRVLQHKVCGVPFWEKKTEQRASLVPDLYISTATILDENHRGFHEYHNFFRTISTKQPEPECTLPRHRLRKLTNKIYIDGPDAHRSTFSQVQRHKLPHLVTSRRASSNHAIPRSHSPTMVAHSISHDSYEHDRKSSIGTSYRKQIGRKHRKTNKTVHTQNILPPTVNSTLSFANSNNLYS